MFHHYTRKNAGEKWNRPAILEQPTRRDGVSAILETEQYRFKTRQVS